MITLPEQYSKSHLKSRGRSDSPRHVFDYVVNKCDIPARVFKIAPRAPRGAKGQSNWSQELRPSDISQTYSPLEIYCKTRRAGIWMRAGPGPLAPLNVNKPNGLSNFATFAPCLRLLPWLFLLRKNRPPPPPSPRGPGRFRFYLSKVFHSVVIVWVGGRLLLKRIFIWVRVCFSFRLVSS